MENTQMVEKQIQSVKKTEKRKLTKKDFILNKNPIPKGSTTYNFASDVKKHGKTSYTQNFATILYK